MTFTTGARPLVVQDALETTCACGIIRVLVDAKNERDVLVLWPGR